MVLQRVYLRRLETTSEIQRARDNVTLWEAARQAALEQHGAAVQHERTARERWETCCDNLALALAELTLATQGENDTQGIRIETLNLAAATPGQGKTGSAKDSLGTKGRGKQP